MDEPGNLSSNAITSILQDNNLEGQDYCTLDIAEYPNERGLHTFLTSGCKLSMARKTLTQKYDFFNLEKDQMRMIRKYYFDIEN